MYSLKKGFEWKESKKVSLNHFDPGFYLCEIKSGKSSENIKTSPLLVRSNTGSSLVVVSPTHTWQAYNSFGGKST